MKMNTSISTFATNVPKYPSLHLSNVVLLVQQSRWRPLSTHHGIACLQLHWIPVWGALWIPTKSQKRTLLYWELDSVLPFVKEYMHVKWLAFYCFIICCVICFISLKLNCTFVLFVSMNNYHQCHLITNIHVLNFHRTNWYYPNLTYGPQYIQFTQIYFNIGEMFCTVSYHQMNNMNHWPLPMVRSWNRCRHYVCFYVRIMMYNPLVGDCHLLLCNYRM